MEDKMSNSIQETIQSQIKELLSTISERNEDLGIESNTLHNLLSSGGRQSKIRLTIERISTKSEEIKAYYSQIQALRELLETI